MRRSDFDMMNPDDPDGDGWGDLRIDLNDYRVEPLDLERVMRFAKQYQANALRLARLDAAERSRADWGRILQGPAGGLLSSFWAQMAGREGSQ